MPLFPSYNRALLYLVSRAYEERPNTPLAGDAGSCRRPPKSEKLIIAYTTPPSSETAAETHGGLDNDPVADEPTGY